jgi:hypothetical protein
MPPRKQPTRLEDLTIMQCSNRCIRKCEKWMGDLTDAIINGEEAYMSVSEGVLNECRAVETELTN